MKPEDCIQVSDKIDPHVLPWRSWGQMLRHHPTALRGIVDVMKPARNVFDAIYRTRAIAKWMEKNACQLCSVACRENPSQQDYTVGVYFGSPPYGPENPVPGIGCLYVDPYLAEHPITWKVVDDERVEVDCQWHEVNLERLVMAAGENDMDRIWIEEIRRAEREWFSNANTAPVALVQLEERQGVSMQHVGTFDATMDLLAADPSNRTRVFGWRPPNTASPDFLPCIGKLARGLTQGYKLSLDIHEASPLLIASRMARSIEAETMATLPDSNDASARRL